MCHARLVTVIHKWLLLLAYPLLHGCALVLEYPITSASVGVWGTTGKGPADHAVSYALKEDCETLRAINSEPICKKNSDVMPDVVDKSFNLEPPRQITNASSERPVGTSKGTQPRSIKSKPIKRLAKEKTKSPHKN